jgi:cytidylate kinase
MAVITISRQVGSGGAAVATLVCNLLGYRYFDKKLMTQVAAEIGLSEKEVIDFSEQHYEVKPLWERLFSPPSRLVAEVPTRLRDKTGADTLSLEQLDEGYCIALIKSTVQAAYDQGNMVIVGRGGQAILQNMPNVLHVRLEAPLEDRIRRIQGRKGLSQKEANQLAVQQDRKTAEYLNRFFGIRWDDPLLYHLVLNTGKWTPEAAAQIIVDSVTQLQPRLVT